MESLSFFMYPFQVVCPIPLYDLQFTTTRDGKPTIRLNTINHRTIFLCNRIVCVPDQLTVLIYTLSLSCTVEIGLSKPKKKKSNVHLNSGTDRWNPNNCFFHTNQKEFDGYLLLLNWTVQSLEESDLKQAVSVCIDQSKGSPKKLKRAVPRQPAKHRLWHRSHVAGGHQN